MSSNRITTTPAHDRVGSSPRGMIIFVVIAYLLAWLAALPAWLTGGLASPWFTVSATAMMFAPTVAALVTLRWVERLNWRSTDRPGILASVGIPLAGRGVRILGWLGLAWLVAILLVAAGYATSLLLGTWQPDLVGFSTLAKLLEQQGVSASMVPPLSLLAVLQLIQAATLGVVITSFATVGEELGWRGYLYPALLSRLPRAAALVVGGLIWGLWHAPVIMLGYNYGHPVLGLPMMCGFTILYGTVLAWLRARSGSVWPAVLGHAVINSVTGVVLLTLGDVDNPPDPVWGTPLGLAGWIVPVVVVGLLVWRGRWQPTDRPKAPSAETGGPEVSPPTAPHRAG